MNWLTGSLNLNEILHMKGWEVMFFVIPKHLKEKYKYVGKVEKVILEADTFKITFSKLKFGAEKDAIGDLKNAYRPPSFEVRIHKRNVVAKMRSGNGYDAPLGDFISITDKSLCNMVEFERLL